MSEATDTELQELKRQVALLRQENAATRTGWMKWLRATGILFLVYGGGVLLGVLQSHVKVEHSPVATTFTFMAIFLAASGGWCLLWSFRWMAEKLMKTA
jgi:hypothetical protein